MSNYQKLANALQNTVENYTPDVLYPKSAKIVNIYDNGTVDVSVKIGDDILLNCKYLGTPKVDDEVLLIPIENNYNKAICICNIIKDNIKYLKDLKDDKDNRLVTDELIEYWNNKADYKIVNSTENGLMSFEDKIKLDNIKEISFSKYAIITKVNDDDTINCREKETDTIHTNVLCLNNKNSVGDTVLLGFVDNDVYNPIVIGNLNQKGGSGGVSSYNDLTDQPSINGQILIGDKNSDELELATKEHKHITNDITDLSNNYYNKTQTINQITNYHDVSKQDSLVSGSNIKTINNQSILGSGNITIQGGGSGYYYIDGTELVFKDLASVVNEELVL